MPSQRIHRIQNLLRAEISTILLLKIKDPRVHMVTISEVDVAPDLKNAHVWVSVYGDKEYQEEALEGLRRAAGFIRSELMKVIALRTMPRLTFDLDTALERGTHTLDVLDQALHGNQSEPGAEPGGAVDSE